MWEHVIVMTFKKFKYEQRYVDTEPAEGWTVVEAMGIVSIPTFPGILRGYETKSFTQTLLVKLSTCMPYDSAILFLGCAPGKLPHKTREDT